LNVFKIAAAIGALFPLRSDALKVVTCFERRQRLREKCQRGMPIGLAERGTAQALGLILAEPEPNGWIFAGRTAQRRLGAIESDE